MPRLMRLPVLLILQAILLKANQLVAYGHWVIQSARVEQFLFLSAVADGGFNGQAGSLLDRRGPTPPDIFVAVLD